MTTSFDISENTIHIVMYLHPVIYTNSTVVTGTVNKVSRTYHTDINPDRVINGPLSKYGEELEPPIREEYNSFIEDCIWLIKEYGFTILKRMTSTSSGKSVYTVVYGIGETPCGSIVYELRISDHPLDGVTIPTEVKNEIVGLLKMQNVLNGSATAAGIDFRIEKVTVGSVINDTWDRAFQRLNNKLKQMKKKIQIRLRARK